jgi:hypothetical protein
MREKRESAPGPIRTGDLRIRRAGIGIYNLFNIKMLLASSAPIVQWVCIHEVAKLNEAGELLTG